MFAPRIIKTDWIPRGATGFHERYTSVAPKIEDRGNAGQAGHEANDRPMFSKSRDHRARDGKVRRKWGEKKANQSRYGCLFMHPHTRDTTLEYESSWTV